MRYVIIGNSAAGVAAIEAIRECDQKNKITVISEETHPNYSRPLISYLLGKKVSLKQMPLRPEDFYRHNNIELLLDKKVSELELKKKEIVLRDNQRLHFDKLLIATGGIPIIPEIKDLALGEGCWTFTRLADAEKIAGYIRDNQVKDAVVIGAGLIGLKATEALINLKIKVTIVELADRILSATFDQKASGIIQACLEKAGCRLIINNTVIKIKRQKVKGKSKNSRIRGIILKNKKEIKCDLVILAIGVKPNIELVKGTAIKTNKGILVDELMQTNVSDVYAAGDCCEGKDLVLDVHRLIAIWPVAVCQGRIAGYNMAGTKKEYSGSFAMNSVELCGIPTISVGQTLAEEKDYQVLEYFDKGSSVYKKLVLKNNRIVGAIFVGDIERAGIYTGLIKDKVDTTSFREQLLKEDFGLISLPKEYRKYLVSGEAALI